MKVNLKTIWYNPQHMGYMANLEWPSEISFKMARVLETFHKHLRNAEQERDKVLAKLKKDDTGKPIQDPAVNKKFLNFLETEMVDIPNLPIKISHAHEMHFKPVSVTALKGFFN